MKNADRVAIGFAALLGLVCSSELGRRTRALRGSERQSRDGGMGEAQCAVSSRTTRRRSCFTDRSGKRTGSLGERAIYGETVMSPDCSRVAVVKNDLATRALISTSWMSPPAPARG